MVISECVFQLYKNDAAIEVLFMHFAYNVWIVFIQL